MSSYARRTLYGRIIPTYECILNFVIQNILIIDYQSVLLILQTTSRINIYLSAAAKTVASFGHYFVPIFVIKRNAILHCVVRIFFSRLSHLLRFHSSFLFLYFGQICESLTSGPCHAIDITREVRKIAIWFTTEVR